MLSSLSKNLFYPAWDIWDKSSKLKRLKQLEQLQWQPLEELKKEQASRLDKLVSHALLNSPFYVKFYQNAGIDSKKFDCVSEFEKLPIMTKHDIRSNQDAFKPASFNRDELAIAKTGGSTGVSLHLYFDKQCQEYRNAAAMLTDMWAGWVPGEKRAAIWGNPPVAKTIKQKLRSGLLDRMIYLDTMELNNQSMSDFVQLWRKEKPQVVFGHSHSIYMFAKFLVDEQIADLRPAGIISTSMMLLDHERHVIERAFGCEVFNRYGCEEVGLIGSECEFHNGMHLNIHDVHVEFINADGEPCKSGEAGKIVVTDLNNYAMPLIRYQVEDVGVPTHRMCECGRGMPLMESLSGRVADFLKRRDGTLVAGVSLVEKTLTAIEGVEQMQLIQNSPDILDVNLVKAANYNDKTLALLESEFKKDMGEDISLKFTFVDEIPQELSGKFRFSICKI